MPQASTVSTRFRSSPGPSGVQGVVQVLAALAILLAFGQNPAAAQRVASVVDHDVPEPCNGRIVF